MASNNPALPARPRLDESTLEARIRSAMFLAGVKSPKMARLVGVTPQTVRNWYDDDNTARPNAAELLAIAIATGVPVEWLDPESPFAGLRWLTPQGSTTPYLGWFTAVEGATGAGVRPRGSRPPMRVTAKPPSLPRARRAS